MKKLSLLLACAFLAAGVSGCALGRQEEIGPAAVPSGEVSAGGEESAPAASSAASGPSAATGESPAQAAPDSETWEQQAVVLTDQIVSCCLQTFDESAGVTALDGREIFQFIATISRYQEEPGYPYGDAVTITEPDSRNPNLVAHVAEADAQSIAYQLFGVADWSYDAPDCYDGSVPEYCFNLEAGLPVSPYSAREAAAEVAGDSVTVSFRLTDSDNYADAAGDGRKDYGQFQAVYQIVSEEGKTFLRFQGIFPGTIKASSASDRDAEMKAGSDDAGKSAFKEGLVEYDSVCDIPFIELGIANDGKDLTKNGQMWASTPGTQRFGELCFTDGKTLYIQCFLSENPEEGFRWFWVCFDHWHEDALEFLPEETYNKLFTHADGYTLYTDDGYQYTVTPCEME